MDDLDALLADLQNSVPDHNVHKKISSPVPSLKQNQQQQHNHERTSGYGSLRTKPTSQSQVYNEQYFSSEENTTPQPLYTHPCGNGHRTSSTSATVTSHPYLHQGTLPYLQKNSSRNLSELDCLLQDLSYARYNSSFEQEKGNISLSRNGKSSIMEPTSLLDSYSCYTGTTEDRPSVDSLLNEMDNVSIYAVPNGSYDQKYLKPRRHVTITVRETKTEDVCGPEEQVARNKNTFFEKDSSKSVYASSATKELDDLMASLSDFKITTGSHHHQTVTDYAKPNKGISHNTQAISESIVLEEKQGDQLDSMLGNLQANMSRQGVTTVQKGCCNACEKPIVGQVITALGKTWHPEHFTCNHCSQELGTRNFFERDGYPYCESDYHNLFSPRCAYCNGAILDKCVTALDKTWHTEHFFCAQCGQQFGEDGFHERDGKPYCRNDYFEMFAPKCNGCNRAIMENYISALNSQWHPDCFVCRDCKKPVKGKSFYAMEGKPVCPICVGVEEEEQPFQGGSFFDHDGLPYCEMHYHAKRGSLCAGCSKPIIGRCITAMFKKFHPEHFVCAFCLKQLNKGTFKEQNDKPYCHPCFDKIFG